MAGTKDRKGKHEKLCFHIGHEGREKLLQPPPLGVRRTYRAPNIGADPPPEPEPDETTESPGRCPEPTPEPKQVSSALTLPITQPISEQSLRRAQLRQPRAEPRTRRAQRAQCQWIGHIIQVSKQAFETIYRAPALVLT
ncbi:hypothetical protein AK812_SmicGene21034 [Symbiodinium microadriaticum]|uniref:Uncharacterized protein n=1 Tax=Symbiodinium microadriaticum TaxID=2951 RepID=A0A1Q9DNC9_SYMMI|nr:hypothetical protein AK812_SmicGene21034 [Symbiodinium microadriaticum]